MCMRYIFEKRIAFFAILLTVVGLGAMVPLHAHAETDGTIDTHWPASGTGFGSAGCLAYAGSLQSDGKMIIAGACASYNGVSAGSLYRLNVDGTLDTAFATNEGTGFNGRIYGTAVQSDGKILATGAFSSFNGTSVTRIARLNSNGTLDSAFNSGGAGFNGDTRGVVLRSNGKILVSGTFTTYNGTSANHIVQLNSDGTIDSGFVYGTGLGTSYSSLQIQPDGKVIVGCACSTYNGTTIHGIARLNTDGTIDSTFNTNAGTGFAGSLGPWFFTIQSDNKIVVTGDITGFNGHSDGYGIYRLNSDGSYDSTFNVEGTGYNSYVYGALIQNDGKIIVPGQYTQLNGVAKGYITRLNSDGSIDSTFNSGGAGYSDQTEWAMYDSQGAVIILGYPITYNGSAAPSSSISRLIRTIVPGAPTSVTGVRGNQQATISFSAPAGNGGPLISGYTVTASPGGVTASGSGSSIVISGLTNGTPYTFTVTANNITGSSSASTASSSVTPATVPGLPVITSAVAGNGQVTLNFTLPDNGGDAITQYTVTTTPGGTTTGTSSPITITGLSNGSSYSFGLTATNTVGTGSSIGINATPNQGHAVPLWALGGYSVSANPTQQVTVTPVAITPTPVAAPTNTPSVQFNQTLSFGMTSADVLALQKFLNTHGYVIAQSGAGSLGHETSYFGIKMRDAVKRYQKAHTLPQSGMVGPMTRTALNAENK